MSAKQLETLDVIADIASARATSAKRLETFDVVADVASARARRFRGGVRGARAPLQVCKPRFGGYAWAGARQGAFAHKSPDLNGVFGRLRCAQRPGAIPRGARRAMRSEGLADDAIQPLKRRESARKVRAGAHGDGDHVLRA